MYSSGCALLRTGRMFPYTWIHLLFLSFMILDDSESQNVWGPYCKQYCGNGVRGWKLVKWIRIQFAIRQIAPSSWVRHPIREADHSPPSTAEDKNGWNCTSTHSILHSGEFYFMLNRTINYGQSRYTSLILSALICRVNSSMAAKWHYKADFISSLVTLQFF
jgi:hypothetical protein